MRDPPAERRLLAEEVGLRLLLERGLDDAGTGAADALAVRERRVPGPAGDVLVDGEQRGDAGPCVKRSRITWPGALGAIIVTSTSGGGTTWLKWMLKPWANMSILPLPSPPLISLSNT